MAYEFNGTNQHLSMASSPVSGYPLTLAAWVLVDSGNDRAIMAVNQSTTPFHRITIYRGSDTRFRAQVFGSVNTSATQTVNSSTGQWYHVCGVFESSTQRELYIDGSLDASNTTTATVNTLNELFIGARRSTVAGLFWDGKIADAGIWNVTLTAAEIASLADGFTCDKVRPQSLVAYFPLVRDLIDYKGGLTITNNNTATVADHPRVYA